MGVGMATDDWQEKFRDYDRWVAEVRHDWAPIPYAVVAVSFVIVLWGEWMATPGLFNTLTAIFTLSGAVCGILIVWPREHAHPAGRSIAGTTFILAAFAAYSGLKGQGVVQ